MKTERILKQIRDIFSGVANKVLPDKRYAVLYALRTCECYFCEHKTKKLGIDSCKLCGCFIQLKVRSVTDTNDCPVGKWINQDYFGRVKYKNIELYKANDSANAFDELKPIFLILREKIKKLCTRAQFREVYHIATMTGKHIFEKSLKKFMEDSHSKHKSKFRDRNQYELEKSIREFNSVIKAMYILDIYNKRNIENVEKN